MSKTDELSKKILVAISTHTRCRVHFKVYSSMPKVGHFVYLSDFDELLAKGMVRFVTDSKEDKFESAKEEVAANFTTIYRLDTITVIKPV